MNSIVHNSKKFWEFGRKCAKYNTFSEGFKVFHRGFPVHHNQERVKGNREPVLPAAGAPSIIPLPKCRDYTKAAETLSHP